ncbi:tetratricopeptide repeat protein [Curvibacter sp. APW13]|uniref:tetratricopeptide repeat protein n=1 Tax=Curvibacter sp. APW13 TaxID=3077236 RepID=UPI0028E0542C|nr:tetratricopeptide repeat protein [Curvibacter sp. APW13]MDT8992462.1 tetratricopeptide repeat protein [Curvibacter sp. APW13]
MRRFHRILACLLVLGAGSAATGWAQSSGSDKAAQQANERIAFYQVMVAELSAQRGELSTAVSLMLDAAQRTRSDKLFERAVELAFAERNANSALQVAQTWARVIPSSARAHRYSLQILIGLNRLDDIAEPLRQLLHTSSDEERAAHLATLPNYFARTQDRAAAVHTVQQALAADLGSPRRGPAAWAALARMQAFAGNEAQTVAALERSAALDPRSDEAALAALQLGPKIAAAAQGLIRQRLDRQPGAELRMAMMRHLVDRQDYRGAYEQLTLLTREVPDHVPAWLVKGSIEVQNNEDALAEQSLQIVLRLLELQDKRTGAEEAAQPTQRNMAEALLLLATLAERSKDYAKAEDYLDRIYNPDFQTRITIRRASIAGAQGQVAQAQALLRELPTNTAEALRMRYNAELQLLRERNLHQQGYDLAAEAAQALPEEPQWRYEQAMFAEKIGRLADMERLLRELIASHPQYHPPYNALGYSLADRNVSLAEARKLIAKALEFAPDDAYIIDSMGWVEFRSGNLAEARRLLEKAFAAQPDAEIAAHLGEVLWQQGQADAARALWKQGLQLNPTNATLLETMRRFQVQP